MEPALVLSAAAAGSQPWVATGSNEGLGLGFRPFGINGLEMVAQIFPRWNPLTSWMRQIEEFQRAAHNHLSSDGLDFETWLGRTVIEQEQWLARIVFPKR